VYLDYYGLEEPPFNITPNPRFLYYSGKHREALARGNVGAEQVDYVIMGQVLQAGSGQMPARQAAAKAGVPMTVPAMTLNKVCLSGIDAIYLADQMIQAGDAEIVVAGGMESMTRAPYLLPNAREGYRMDHGQLVDSMIGDGLWCAFDAVHMGAGTENYVGQVGNISREAQDEFAAGSQQRRFAARPRAERDAPVSHRGRRLALAKPVRPPRFASRTWATSASVASATCSAPCLAPAERGVGLEPGGRAVQSAARM
jgi:hypothetical protein